VVDWNSSANTVELEPQFVETWVTRGGERKTEDSPEGANIANVPVCYPRSGQWSMTFPIVTGSFGLVICTKYSLNAWRNSSGARVDPGDLRRFTMSGATFHPVNLSPNSAELELVTGVKNGQFIRIGKDGDDQYVALANLVHEELTAIKTAFDSHIHLGEYLAPGDVTTVAPSTPMPTPSSTASSTVKVSE
jgi:hypothetical protein